MSLKKTLVALTALTLTLSSLGASNISAIAADEGSGYTEGKLPIYLYSLENQSEIDCRYYDNMPNVPYINVADYFKNWASEDLTVTKNEDGTFTLINALNCAAMVDVEQDTFTFDAVNPVMFVSSELDGEESSYNMFGQPAFSGSPALTEGEVPSVVIRMDLGKYDIDIKAEEDTVWFPVTTLCDFFSSSIHQTAYVNHTMFFFDTTEGKISSANFLSEEIGNAYLQEYANGRPADMAAYNYNEICLVMDYKYGFPGRIPLNDVLAEKGLDAMLSETNDDTRLVKEHLLSENVYEYIAGLFELSYYMWDGGHTVYYAGAAYDLPSQIGEAMNYTKPDDNYEMASDYFTGFNADEITYNGVSAARAEMLKNVDYVKTYDDAIYVEKGDTAIFITDEFFSGLDQWMLYYNTDTELPQQMLSEYFECLNYANDNANIKNFVIDVSMNGGGYLLYETYLMSLISDDNYVNCIDTQLKLPLIEGYIFDKNLDKAFDELDEALSFDLNIGVLSSRYSFSAANLLVSDARDAGLLVLGEQSGGGCCSIEEHLTPDGMYYALSSGIMLTNGEFESIDLGIAPDVELVSVAEDGTKDYSNFYDFDAISKAFADFYKEENPETTTTTTTGSETTTTTTTTTTTVSGSDSETTTTTTTNTDTTTVTSDGSAEETTTTTAVTTVNPDTEETTVSESTDTETTTTTVVTTASGELPQTGVTGKKSYLEAIACLMLVSGVFIVTSVIKKENE